MEALKKIFKGFYYLLLVGVICATVVVAVKKEKFLKAELEVQHTSFPLVDNHKK